MAIGGEDGFSGHEKPWREETTHRVYIEGTHYEVDELPAQLGKDTENVDKLSFIETKLTKITSFTAAKRQIRFY